MRDSSTSRSPLLFATAVFALTAAGAQARTLTLEVTRMRHPQVQASVLRVVAEEQADRSSIRISATRLDVPLLGISGRLDWRCTLGTASGGARACSGPVQLHADDGTAQTAELAARFDVGRVELALSRGESSVFVAIPLADAPIAASLQRVPAAWLRSLVNHVWPGGELREGVLDVDATLHRDRRAEIHLSATNLAFNTLDGTAGGTGLMISAHLQAVPETRSMHAIVDASLGAGLIRLGAVRVQLPATPVEARLDAMIGDDGRWDIARFAWTDRGTLELEASGELQPSAMAPLRTLHARIAHARLPQASARYAQALLPALGLQHVAITGTMTGEIDVDMEGVQHLQLATPGLDASDSIKDVAVTGVRGGIEWAATGQQPATTLAWTSAYVRGLRISGASARWQSRNGALHLLGSLQTRLFDGTLRLTRTILDPSPGEGAHLETAFALDGIGYDNAAGTLAAANIRSDGELRLYGVADAPRVHLDARLSRGEMLAGSIYVKLPVSPVTIALDARRVDAIWHLDAFDWNDPGTLALSASGEIAPEQGRPLRALRIDLRKAQLVPALERYAGSWLAAKGYPGLSAAGSLSGSLTIDAQGLQRFALAADAVDLRDSQNRFAFAGVQGGVDWEADADRPESTLAWKSFELLRIPFGPARASLESRAGQITLAQPLAVDVLGGQLRLERLGLQPRSARGERYAGSFAVVGIEMAQLSAALGWPRFGGNLSGGIPEIVLVGDMIELRGGLDLYVFDGHLGVSGLTLERPFGVAPSLGANIHFEQLDLEQVTSAFSFGGMSGRLNGTITDLRLVDWSPVTFDAWLRTAGGGRMSYNAVNDLTTIGGGGLSANLQTMALKLFDSFGYRRLGIRCTLRDEVCKMGGIEPPAAIANAAASSAGAGYTIVEGSGVPRISIVGHGSRVDWPTLVQRLQEATQGKGPVVE